MDVILNRVDDRSGVWGDDIASVITQRSKFTSYWDGGMDKVWSRRRKRTKLWRWSWRREDIRACTTSGKERGRSMDHTGKKSEIIIFRESEEEKMQTVTQILEHLQKLPEEFAEQYAAGEYASGIDA